MSYDLYFWRWRRNAHVSPGTCYLLMSDGLECPDAAEFDATGLEAELRGSLRDLPAGQVDCEVLPRGVILESHGVDGESLLDRVMRVARRNQAVVFDPQRDEVSDEDRRAAAELCGAVRSADEQTRLEVELPGLLSRAEAGDAAAQVELGNRYFFGETVPKNESEAFGWYLRAATAGSDAGMVNVASCYRRAEGVPEDLSHAIAWYVRAMKTDQTFAPFELAGMYERGEGVARDREKAIELYLVADRGEHPEARAALRRLGALPPAPAGFVRP